MADKNQVATQKPMEMAIDNKFINQLSEQLTQKQQYGLTFPPNYNVTNALNSAYMIIQDLTVKKKQGNDWVDHPVLSICTKQSVATALIDMTVQALNPMKKQCYFVAFGNKLILMRSYQGTMAAAKRVGVKNVSAEVIYEGDTFKYHIEYGVKIIDEHTQDFMNIDITKIKGAYAILTLDDGTTYTEIMNINQLKKAWSKGKYDSTKSNDVHNEFADQMAKKTVINRACKNFINSSDDANLTEAFDSTSENEYIDQAQETLNNDVETHANSEDFEIPEEIESVQGEVVMDDVEDSTKQENNASGNEPVTDDPDWMK
jgi:recombination protein RecT